MTSHSHAQDRSMNLSSKHKYCKTWISVDNKFILEGSSSGLLLNSQQPCLMCVTGYKTEKVVFVM